MLRRKRVLAAAGSVALAAGIAVGAGVGTADASTADASTGATTATATTVLHTYPDPSGYASDTWAYDTVTRVATVTLGLPVAAADCGSGAVTCYSFTGTIKDTGTAVAVAGATSPGAQAVPITGTPRAVVSARSDVTFDTSSDAPNAALVPTEVNGAGVSPADWVEQFFPVNTKGSTPDLTNWSSTFTDSATCEYFVFAYNVSRADSGDITGVNHCAVAPLTAPGPVTATTAAFDPDLTVAWPSVAGACVYEIDVTGPSGGSKADVLVTADSGVFSIATVGNPGHVKVRAGIYAVWDNKTWIAWGPYSATKAWKF